MKCGAPGGAWESGVRLEPLRGTVAPGMECGLV
nr:MAG TPA: hypothetical protein [Caudoviricetes sp.]